MMDEEGLSPRYGDAMEPVRILIAYRPIHGACRLDGRLSAKLRLPQ
jgi:hypothetical protein